MRGLKEMRVVLFGLYETAKEHVANNLPGEPIPIEKFRTAFADELFTEARARLRDRENDAAQGTLLLSGVQALALNTRGKLLDRLNLRFRESAEQALESMAGFEVIGAALLLNGKECATFPKREELKEGDKLQIALVRTNGIDESVVFADAPDIALNETLFVLEPFVSNEDRTGKTWTEMTADERAEAAGRIRNASNMPKFLMKRRAFVEELHVRHDNRTAWIEGRYVKVEPFERSKEEELALLEEFHPSKDLQSEIAGESEPQDQSASDIAEALESTLGDHVKASGLEELIEDGELQERSKPATEGIPGFNDNSVATLDVD